MNQINIRVNSEVNGLLEYLAKQKNIPKTVYAKQLLLDQLTTKIIPILLEDYQHGKIGIKKILKLTSLTPDQLLELFIKNKIDPPIEPKLDDYTFKVAENIIKKNK